LPHLKASSYQLGLGIITLGFSEPAIATNYNNDLANNFCQNSTFDECMRFREYINSLNGQINQNYTNSFNAGFAAGNAATNRNNQNNQGSQNFEECCSMNKGIQGCLGSLLYCNDGSTSPSCGCDGHGNMHTYK